MELKRVWLIVLSFFLGVGLVTSVKVLAAILAIITGGNVGVGVP
jgi:hypothetical protein